MRNVRGRKSMSQSLQESPVLRIDLEFRLFLQENDSSDESHVSKARGSVSFTGREEGIFPSFSRLLLHQGRVGTPRLRYVRHQWLHSLDSAGLNTMVSGSDDVNILPSQVSRWGLQKFISPFPDPSHSKLFQSFNQAILSIFSKFLSQ
ncbi:unnamed protein product [Larinioides sclopetarius]|uniref:Maturase K n=1 Tax=Larinioides sclopetarius TaxID=280406 RepID=A0AAV2AJW9_9ARAC